MMRCVVRLTSISEESRESERRELARESARVMGRVLPARLEALPRLTRLLDENVLRWPLKSGPRVRTLAAIRPKFCSRLFVMVRIKLYWMRIGELTWT